CPLEPPRSPVSPVPVPPPPNRPQPPPLRCRKLATSSAPAIAPSVRRTFRAGQGTGFLNQYLPANQTTKVVSSAPTTAPPSTARARTLRKPRFSNPLAATTTATLP